MLASVACTSLFQSKVHNADEPAAECAG